MVLCDLEFWRNKKNVPVEQLKLRPEHFTRAADLKSEDLLTHHLVSKGLDLLLNQEQYSDLDQVIEDKGWLKTFRNPEIIEKIVVEAIDENPKLVRKHLNNKNQRSLDLIVQVTK